MKEFKGGKKRPFGLCYELNKKKYRPTFATRKELNEHRRMVELSRLNAAKFIDPERYAFLMRAEKCQELLGAVTIEEAVNEYLSICNRRTACTETLQEAVSEYLEDINRRGVKSHLHDRKRLQSMIEFFGGSKSILLIDRKGLQEWVDSLGSQNLNPVTIRNYLRRARAMFSRLVDMGKLSNNPARVVSLPKVELKEPQIIPVDALKRHFEKNIAEDRSYCGIEGVLFFSGLRSSMMAPGKDDSYRLEKSMLYPDEKMIIIPARAMKAGRDHYIEDVPESVFAWAELITQKDWEIVKSTFINKRIRARQRSGVKLPPNCARKSFGTYRKAFLKSRELAARDMAHKGTNVFGKHYEGFRDYDGKIITYQMAIDYFSILP